MVVVSSACVSCDPLAPYWAKMRANVRTWAVPCNAGVAGGGGGGGLTFAMPAMAPWAVYF